LPNIKSAEKMVRVTERKRLRNKSVRTMCKTNVTKAERLIFLGDLGAAQEAVAVAITSLDKAAEKGIIHPNNAARRKSRLMKKFNQLQAQAPTPAPVAKPKAAKPKAKAAKPKPKAKAEPKTKAAEAKAKPKAAETKAKAEATKAKPKAAKPKTKATKAKTAKAEKAKSPGKLDSEG
jgi:small subunit ribosomal protein S20